MFKGWIDWDIGLIAYWNMAKRGRMLFIMKREERTYNDILFASYGATQ
jgi:hypothetical protein